MGNKNGPLSFESLSPVATRAKRKVGVSEIFGKFNSEDFRNRLTFRNFLDEGKVSVLVEVRDIFRQIADVFLVRSELLAIVVRQLSPLHGSLEGSQELYC